MGPCKKITNLQNDFDFEEYATTNGGHWKYQLVPNLDFFKPIKYAGVIYKPTGTKGVYDITIYNILKSGKKEIFSDGRITYLGNGHAVNNATETGGDTTTDYRNLLVSHEHPDKELEQVLKEDHSRKFKNDLIKRPVEK